MNGGKFIKIILAVILVSFFGYQIYSVAFKPITTATATNYEAINGVDIEGYFVRQEQVIDYEATGNERYVVDDGEKVSKNGVIAEIYSSPAAAATKVRIDELNKQISVLETMNSSSDPSSVDLDTLNNKIQSVYLDFISDKQNGNFLDSDDFAAKLLIQINKKQILTGQVNGFDNLILSLKNEVASLSSAITAPSKTLTSNASGFFVGTVDGLEDILKISEIENMDINIFDQLKDAEQGSGFGKIVTSYDWYIIAKMTGDDYLKFNVSDTVTLKTTIEGSKELVAKVERINVSDQKNEALIVFSCNTMNGELATTRYSKMTVITEKHTGIRISNKAIRVVDGKTGVYIIQGSIVKFKPIEIIYTTDNFSVCKIDETNTASSLRLYDEVIEKGKNLYDGKYID